MEVELADGRAGDVAERYVGMAVGWRAAFLKQDGAWTMTALVVGD